MDKWICDVCGEKFKIEVDLLAHQFNSPCERELQKREQAAELAQLQAIATAAREVVYAVKKHGVCVCGHDGKLTSQDCPIHGHGATQLAAALAALEQETK